MVWWENSFLKVKDNKLYLGDKEASEIAKRHGTPLYVYSREQLISNFRSLLKAFVDRTQLGVRICFAMKANPNRKILEILRKENSWIDAVSPGEVSRAVSVGFPPQKILFTGTSVSMRDLQEVFSHDRVTINIDALEQLELMKEIKRSRFRNKKIRVSVRWNPGVGRGFSPRTITAGERSSDRTPVKFGVEQKKVVTAFEKATQYGFVPVGLHQHLGSGWVRGDLETIKVAVDRMIHKAAELEKKGFELEFLDFGGGFGPIYYKSQGIFPVEEYAEYICQKIKKARLKIKALALEPGKYLMGNTGVLLLRVEYMKKSYGNIFACVNGGTFNTVPRPAIYAQAHHEIVNCSDVDGGNKQRVTIAGNLCETGDVFAKERLMPLPKRGDILAVLCAGAYCRSMASNYNLREKPKEIII